MLCGVFSYSLSPTFQLPYNELIPACGMEQLEKLEIIVKYDLAEKKGKRENTVHSSNLYILGLDHQISTLEEIMIAINAIKRNHYSVSDEMISGQPK
jgi:hypothetical protein